MFAFAKRPRGLPNSSACQDPRPSAPSPRSCIFRPPPSPTRCADTAASTGRPRAAWWPRPSAWATGSTRSPACSCPVCGVRRARRFEERSLRSTSPSRSSRTGRFPGRSSRAHASAGNATESISGRAADLICSARCGEKKRWVRRVCRQRDRAGLPLSARLQRRDVRHQRRRLRDRAVPQRRHVQRRRGGLRLHLRGRLLRALLRGRGRRLRGGALPQRRRVRRGARRWVRLRVPRGLHGERLRRRVPLAGNRALRHGPLRG